MRVYQALDRLKEAGDIPVGGVEWYGDHNRATFLIRHIHPEGGTKTPENMLSDFYAMRIAGELGAAGAGPACMEGASHAYTYETPIFEAPGEAAHRMTSADFKRVVTLRPDEYMNNLIAQKSPAQMLAAVMPTRGAEDPAREAEKIANDGKMAAMKQDCANLLRPINTAYEIAKPRGFSIGLHPVWDAERKTVVRIDVGEHIPGKKDPEQIVTNVDAKNVRETLQRWMDINAKIDSEKEGEWQVPRDDFIHRLPPGTVILYGGAHKKAQIERVKKNPSKTGVCVITHRDYEPHAAKSIAAAKETTGQLNMLLNLALKGDNKD